MSDPIASFQGLGTGINFRDLVDQIIAAESQPIVQMRQRISQANARDSAWTEFQTRLRSLNTLSSNLSDLSSIRSFNTSVADASVASATAGLSAREGSFSLAVQQLAASERLGSDVFASRTEALGFSGDFVINGRTVSLSADQSLSDVATAVNAVSTGTESARVRASVVGSSTEGYRLVLTSQDPGAGGIDLVDSPSGALQSLGFLDATTTLANRTSDGARSGGFASSSGTLGGLLGLASGSPAGTVNVGGLSVAVDLATDSLEDIATAINTAAAGAGSAITAEVVADSSGGSTVYRLDVSGTTSFTDAGGVLESIGLLERGRSAVAQQVEFAAFTDGDGSTVATGGTLLTDLWSGGASSGVQVGDTLDLVGTRGDGTSFSTTFTVQSDSSYQDLVDTLNAATGGFQEGTRTATASIDAEGRLVVTDDAGGSSRLSLAVYSNNEGGGRLDFGEETVAARGRLRELVTGQDAIFQVDGQTFTRSSNSVSDVVAGVTVNLTGVSDTPTNVQITRDLEVAADAVEEFMDAMNQVLEFANSERYTPEEGSERTNPLFGDAVLRGMKSQLKNIFETTLGDAFGDVSRLGDIGITIQRSGQYAFDREAFTSALQADPSAVERLFQVSGSGSVSSLQYIFSTDDTGVGSYDVNITQAASRARAASSGFAGYVDDGTPDTLQVTHSGSGSVYSVLLNDGDTAQDIVDALNAEFDAGAARQLQATTGLYADAGGTPAGTGTLLQDLYSGGGASLGVADGDTLSISGTNDSGDAILASFSVTDVTTQTVGDLAEAISSALGTSVEVTLENGLLTATSTTNGGRSFSVSLTSDNAGGGSFSVGSLSTVEAGRTAGVMEAAVESGEVVIRTAASGATAGFDLAVTPGGGSGAGSLGITAGSYAGTDVAGTIGGEAATGEGSTLTADEGTAADGLVITYSGADTGVVGQFTFTRGIAALMEQLSDQFLEPGGSLDGVQDRIDDQVDRFNDRIEAFEDRMERRRAALIRQFTTLEQSIAQLQARGNFLTSQLAGLPTGGGGGLI